MKSKITAEKLIRAIAWEYCNLLHIRQGFLDGKFSEESYHRQEIEFDGARQILTVLTTADILEEPDLWDKQYRELNETVKEVGNDLYKQYFTHETE